MRYMRKTEYKNVYAMISQKKKGEITDYAVHIVREGRGIIRKRGFTTAKEASKAGDLALLKNNHPQINNSYKRIVNKN